MKTINKYLALIIITCFFSNCNNGIQEKKFLENSQVFKGEIYLKANNINQNGIVRVYLNEGDGLDKLRRGVVYQYSSDLKSLKLYDEVYFKIAKIGNLQIAEIDNDLSLEYKETKLSMKDVLGINLHQSHAEQGAHKKQHVIRKGVEINGILEIVVQDATTGGLPDPNGLKDTIHLYTSHYNVIDTTKAYYKSTLGRVNNNILYSLSLDHPPH